MPNSSEEYNYLGTDRNLDISFSLSHTHVHVHTYTLQLNTRLQSQQVTEDDFITAWNGPTRVVPLILHNVYIIVIILVIV